MMDLQNGDVFSNDDGLTNGGGERPEYLFGNGLFHSFGVELRADDIFAVNRRFNRKVGRDGDDFRVFGSDICGLTVRGVYMVKFTEYFSAGRNGVKNVLFVRVSVHVFQRSAEKHVHELKTSAYREDGQIFSREIIEQVEFEFVFDEIHVAGGNVAAIKRGKNVAASDEQKSAVSV